MATVIVCDLCGKPLTIDDRAEFKIKKFIRFGGYQYIDAHDSCVKKLLNAVEHRKQKQEFEDRPPCGSTSQTDV